MGKTKRKETERRSGALSRAGQAAVPRESAPLPPAVDRLLDALVVRLLMDLRIPADDEEKKYDV